MEGFVNLNSNSGEQQWQQQTPLYPIPLTPLSSVVVVEEDRQPVWLQLSELPEQQNRYSTLCQSPPPLPLLPTTPTGSSVPMLGFSPSFTMDVSNPNSKSTVIPTTAEQLSFEEDDDQLEMQLQLQQLQHPYYNYDGIAVSEQGPEELSTNMAVSDTQQRKGMVRREFGRRVLGFKKKKTNSNNNNSSNNNINHTLFFENKNNNDIIDTSNNHANDININDVNANVNVNNAADSSKPIKMKSKILYSPFSTSSNRSKMMMMVVD